jgi:hypothetical protein
MIIDVLVWILAWYDLSGSIAAKGATIPRSWRGAVAVLVLVPVRSRFAMIIDVPAWFAVLVWCVWFAVLARIPARILAWYDLSGSIAARGATIPGSWRGVVAVLVRFAVLAWCVWFAVLAWILAWCCSMPWCGPSLVMI